MKKTIGSLVILVTLLVGVVGSASFLVVPAAKATYVEGLIEKDTVWTRVDSPFVLSGHVRILSTLTIEPDVEVRFGGNFSLIVEGKLIANGTSEKTIKFTSNSHEPYPGSWQTIQFVGPYKSSMVFCKVEYGIIGVTMENGILTIQNSSIASSSREGVKIINGYLEISDSEISDNQISGITIEGGQVRVQENQITKNQDGIILTGNLTSEIDLIENNITANTHSGISLEASKFSATSILRNMVSANPYGFLISTDTGTYITNNYISKNDIGIFYMQGTDHVARFNDIYENNLGMDVSPDARVDATRNFWGKRNGPYHEFLNPYGQGNTVGGDGTNLDFIFFLTASFEHVNSRPTAVLWSDKALVAPNQNVTFVGANSYDEGRIDQYYFSFGDNSSTWTTLSLFAYRYPATGTYNADLKVIDDFGAESESASITIDVQNLEPLRTSISLDKYIVNYNEDVPVTVYVSDETSPVANATVTLFSVKGGSFTPTSGLTNSTGHFTTIFKAPNVTDLTDTRLIVRASQTGYADGSDSKDLRVVPPLRVDVTSNPSAIKSEDTVTVTVHVRGSYEQAVQDAFLTVSSDCGSISPATGITDSNGNAIFHFSAPQTLVEINANIIVTATRTDYADGSGQGTVTVVPRTLTVQMELNPSTIVSQATSTVTAFVSSDGRPISGANIAASTTHGNLSSLWGTTDSNGTARFIYGAPQTTTTLNASITVLATKTGYIEGQREAEVRINPRVLSVATTASAYNVTSETRINVTINVTYDSLPIPEANVSVEAEGGGEFSATNTLANIDGRLMLQFTAPQANTPSNVTLKTKASKAGYVDGESLLTITVNPGPLSVEVTPGVSPIGSRETTIVTVVVKSNTTLMANASVTITASYGDFSTTTETTNSNGSCVFTFTAPRATSQLNCTISVDVTKNGFIATQKNMTVLIKPERITETEGGWPLAMILLIVIPIIIVVMVVLLVKLKVITISKEETV